MSSLGSMKIRHKLLAIYGVVVVLPILAVGIYLNNEMRNIFIDQVLSETTSNMNRIEERLRNLFDTITPIADLISVNQDFIALADHHYENNLEFFLMHRDDKVMRDFFIAFSEVSNIRFYSLNPTMLHGGHFFVATKEIQETDWFVDALKRDGRLSWGIVADKFSGRRYLTLTQLVKNWEGEQLGVLNIYVATQYLTNIFQDEPYEVILTLNHETIVFNEGEIFLEKPHPFEEGIYSEEDGSRVFHDVINGKEVLVNLSQFRSHRALDSEIQIATIIPIQQVTSRVNEVMEQVFLVVGGFLGISFALILIFVITFDRKIKLLKRAMTQVAGGDFTISPSLSGGKDELHDIYAQLYDTMMSIQHLTKEIYAQQLQKEMWMHRQKESEFKRLATQINPHFLYNTLEMIRVKAVKGNSKEIAHIVNQLSRLLRRSLESDIHPIPLKKELEFITMYLEIQKLRFKDKIDYKITVDLDHETYRILPLIIQPLVENAFIHGIEMKEGQGNIHVHIYQKKNRLWIEIKDNGLGFGESRLREIQELLASSVEIDGESIGLMNVHQRIQIYYGKEYGITLESEINKGTIVYVELPY